jgi:hypothetical protein
MLLWICGVFSLFQVFSRWNLALDWHPYLSIASMDYKELHEIQRVLQNHEEFI